MVCVRNRREGFGKTTPAINLAVLRAHRAERVLVVDADPQPTLTRQFGLDVGAPGVNLVDVLAGRLGGGFAGLRAVGAHAAGGIPGWAGRVQDAAWRRGLQGTLRLGGT